MIRATMCLRSMRVLVIVLMGLMIAPFAGADDYSHLFSAGNLSSSQGSPVIAMEDSESDSHLCCPCLICMEGLGELSPTVAPPEAGAWNEYACLGAVSSLYHPEILRPPIS